MGDRAPTRRRRRTLSSPRHWRLATRLTVAMLALLLLLQALGLAASTRQAEERRATEVANAVTLAQTLATLVDAVTHDLEGTTLAAVLALGASERPITQAEVGPYLQALAAQYGLLRAIFITDLEGRVTATNGTGLGVTLGDRPYLRALRAGGDAIWSGSLSGLQSGEVTVAFGRTVRGPDGLPRAYLIAAFYPERLIESLPAGLPADGAISLIDQRGLVLYASDRPQIGPVERDASAAPGIAAALAGAVVTVEGVATPLAGEARFGALAPVARTGWVVAFTRPQAALEGALRGQLLTQAGTLAPVLLGAAIIAALLARRLTRPLAELAGAAAAIAAGERPAVPASGADPDVAELAEAMRRMGAAVAAREDSLRLLADASAVLAESLDAATTLRHLTRLAVPRLADWAVAYLVADDGRARRLALAGPTPAAIARVEAGMGPADVEPAPSDPLTQALESRVPVLVAEITDAMLATTGRDAAHLDALGTISPRSQMVVPLVAGGRVLGVLSLVMAGSGRRYGPADLALVEEVAGRAALALDHARLYAAERAARREAQAARARLAVLADAGEALAVSLDLGETLAAVVRLAVANRADYCFVDLLVPGGGLERVAVAHADPALAEAVEGLRRYPSDPDNPHSVVGRVVRGGRTEQLTLRPEEWVTRIAQDADHARFLRALRPVTCLAAPLTARGQVSGALVLYRAEPQPPFDAADAALAEELARRAGLAIDNSHLYAAERAARAEAEEAVRARDTFLSIAAHELRTPLTALKGGVQLLERRRARADLTPEALERTLANMGVAANRLAGLIDDLLDVARLRTGHLALAPLPTDLVALTRVVAGRVGEVAGQAHRIVVEGADGLMPVRADAGRVDQVLTNLLDNAIKYSPTGGEVVVTVLPDGDGVRIAVRDEGIGLPAGAETAIFAPFGRAENAARSHLPGMGLGLYICRGIVERHGGWIRAQSAGEGEGTTMTLWLPRAGPAAEEPDLGETEGRHGADAP